jgi:hypothetical protein
MKRTTNRCNWLKYIAGLVVCAATSAGASAQTRHDAGAWLVLFGNGKFESREESPLRWWFDGQSRFLDDAGGFNQLLIRPGLGYALRGDHTLWYGYAYIRTAPVGLGEEFDEHRMWQQWTYTPSVDNWSFLHRSRLEQRWVETGSDVGLRWRQMARVQYKLTDTPQWSLIAWDEAFFHLNNTDWGARAGFDQNRAFFGVGYKHSPEARIRIEVGYLNQFIFRRGGESRMNHILSLSLCF